MKRFIAALVLTASVSAKAEWYVVTKVLSYNVVEVKLSEGHASKSGVNVRIRNLEKIEYIKNDRTKVLLNGKEPKKILEQMMLGQIVWIDEVETINGEKVASIYPSYEQVLKVFTHSRMSGQFTITPAIKQKLSSVQKRMISELKNGSPDRGNGKPDDKSYENSYSKALFVYDSLDWFKQTGQYLPVPIQELYVDWLGDYLTASGNDARNLEIKIGDMRKRHALYRDFLLEE